MMLDRRQWMVLCGAATLGHPVLAQSIDHSHAAWSRLLQQYVVVQRGGRASQMRYAGLLAQRSDLQPYLRQLSAVSRSGFESFSRAQQMAFPINAYNAFTVELILTRYPRLASIKDLGNFLSSPWKQRWIALLGETVSLDDIETDRARIRSSQVLITYLDYDWRLNDSKVAP